MKLVSKIFLAAVFITVLTAMIAYARGYRLDIEKRSLQSTGILSVNSYPKAAKIFLNGELKGVTDANISLPPGKYQIIIKKDGYTSLQKNIVLKGEIVQSVDALLFPTNPSLTPLTNLGIVKTFLIEQSDRLLLFSQNNQPEKDGIYVFDPNRVAISLFPPLKLIVLKSRLPSPVDFQETEVSFSPDEKQAIINFKMPTFDQAYLFSLEEENKQLFEVTTSKDRLIAAWDEEKIKDIDKIVESFLPKVQKIASDSMKIISFSPNKTKVLYQAKANLTLPLIINPPLIASSQTTENRQLIINSLYVYDVKEDKNFIVENWKTSDNFPLWYPDSKHFVINEEKQIVITEYDSQNRQIVYSGPYDKEFLGVNTEGKLLILTNLNSQINKLPDIYAVGIK